MVSTKVPCELGTVRPIVFVFPSHSALYLTKNILTELCGHWNDQGENCGKDIKCINVMFSGSDQAAAMLSLIFVCIYKTRADTE
jgi:hypothetical protein